LIAHSGLACAVAATVMLFSSATLAEPVSTIDQEQLRGETRSATIAEADGQGE